MTRKQMLALVREGLEQEAPRHTPTEIDRIVKLVEKKTRGQQPDLSYVMNIVLRESWKLRHGGDASEWDRVAASAGVVI